MGALKSAFSRLRMFIHIIVLNLTEIPVIGFQYLQKIIGISMKRKTDILNLPLRLFLLNPFHNPKFFYPFPRCNIVQHMHQIIFHMICPETLQLLFKITFHISWLFQIIMRKFCGNIYLITMALCQKFTQAFLTSTVCIGSVKIIHPVFKGKQQFPLCFFLICGHTFFGKTQTSISQNGQLLPVLWICSV